MSFVNNTPPTTPNTAPKSQETGYDPYVDLGMEDIETDESTGQGDDYSDDIYTDETESGEGQGPSMGLSLDSAFNEIKRIEALLEESKEIAPQLKGDLEKQISELWKKYEKARFSEGETQTALLSEIQADITAMEANITGIGDEGGDPYLNLKNDILATIDAVESNENLKGTKKAEEFLEKLNKWLIALDDEQMVDIEMVQGEVDTLKSDFNKISLFPASISNLAELFPELEPGDIEKKFKTSGVDLPITELTPKVINVLASLDSNLASALDAVKTNTVAEYDKFNSAWSAQEQINANNRACTSSEGESHDTSNAQTMVDLKLKQHPLSKNTLESRVAATEALLPYLQALFGEKAEVEKMDPASTAGAKGNYDRYMASDKIKIDGKIIDLFDNTSGGLLVSETEDSGPFDGKQIKVDYDGEESGSWSPTINAYGMNDIAGAVLNDYDDDGGFHTGGTIK